MVINWSNITSWVQVLQVANTNSNSWFWTLIMFAIFFIALMLFSVINIQTAVLSASFVGLILGIFLSYGGLIAWEWVLVFVGLILIMFLYISWTGKKI